MFRLGLRPLQTTVRSTSRRFLNTVKATAETQEQILRAQRLNRPQSPDLTIYQPQLTWYLSSVHRVSGVILGAGAYAVAIAFGASSLLGLGLTGENLSQWYHSFPQWLDYTVKGSAAYLFAFHFGNGIRHLIWDTGRELTIKGVYRTGYAVLGLTAVLGSYLLYL